MVKHKDWISNKIIWGTMAIWNLNDNARSTPEIKNADEPDHMVSKHGKNIPKFPTIEWINARSVDRITNNVNIVKYVDTDTKNAETVENKIGNIIT